MGRVAFEAYCAAVGGKTFDGKPIPGWDELHGDRLKVQGGWEAAAKVVREATIDYLAKLGAESAANPPVIQREPTRWQPLPAPVEPEAHYGPGPVGSFIPAGHGEAPQGVPVEVNATPDDDRS